MKLKSIMFLFVPVVLLAIGLAGVVLKHPALQQEGPWFLGLAVLIAAYMLLKETYYSTDASWQADSNQPKALPITWGDYFKAFVCWLDSFKRTYAVEPGLYYTGARYDKTAPLLVTANYHLTVFLLVRRLAHLNVRLLVVDTEGINVWCSAGKGRFSNDAIFEQLNRYDKDILTDDDRLTLILPKLCFAGVDLPALRQAGYNAIIGPVHCRDIPAYLATKPLADCDSDRVLFGMQSRLFTLLPGMIQILKNTVTLLLALWVVHLLWHFTLPVTGVLALVVVLKIAYVVLFPYLPGKWFAVKGLWLGVFVCVVLGGMAGFGAITVGSLVTAVLFTLASGMYLGQYYAGSSAVSNMTSMRKETARLLPVYVLLYVASLVAFVVKEAL